MMDTILTIVVMVLIALSGYIVGRVQGRSSLLTEIREARPTRSSPTEWRGTVTLINDFDDLRSGTQIPAVVRIDSPLRYETEDHTYFIHIDDFDLRSAKVKIH